MAQYTGQGAGAPGPKTIRETQNIFMNNKFAETTDGVDRSTGETLSEKSIYVARSRDARGKLQTPFPYEGIHVEGGIASGNNTNPPSPSRNFWPAKEAGEADTQAYSGLGVTDGSEPQAFSNLDRFARYLENGLPMTTESGAAQGGLGVRPTKLFQEYVGLQGYAENVTDLGDESGDKAAAAPARVVMRSAALGVATPWHFLSAAYLRNDITQYSSGAVGGNGASQSAKNAYASGTTGDGPYGWEGHDRSSRY
jgi:hypothetical protein